MSEGKKLPSRCRAAAGDTKLSYRDYSQFLRPRALFTDSPTFAGKFLQIRGRPGRVDNFGRGAPMEAVLTFLLPISDYQLYNDACVWERAAGKAKGKKVDALFGEILLIVKGAAVCAHCAR